MVRAYRRPVAKFVATLRIWLKARTGLVLPTFLRGGGPAPTLSIYKYHGSVLISVSQGKISSGYKFGYKSDVTVVTMNQQGEQIEPLMKPKEVGRLLNCSLPWVYKAAGQGLIPCIRIPCSGEGGAKPRFLVRFRRKDVFDFIENHYQ